MTAELDRILDAHGGLSYWRSLAAVDLEMSARGFLFTTKHVALQRRMRLTVKTQVPEVILHDYPTPGHSTIFLGADRVETRDSSGQVTAARADPRAAFPYRRRLLYWDPLDLAYFCGYAMWNYIALPFLLTEPGFTVQQQPGTGGGVLLKVGFPPGLPTHSPRQEFHFDSTGRLTRHDYTAEVIGRWARGAHLCSEYRQFGGMWLPTRRRVYPQGPFGRPLPAPTIVALDIHNAVPRPE